MKKIIIIILACISFVGYSQSENKDTKKGNVLIVSAHPDDWEYGMSGTAYLLSKDYNIHVIIATKGERGLQNKGKTFDETTAIRIVEAENACKLIGAKVHWMGKIDQEAHANEDGINQVVKLLEELDPVMIFTMWNIEVSDHACASTIARLALYRTKMIYDREVYFFEAGRGGQTNQFIPDFYVNVTNVMDKKAELMRCHVCQNENDGMVKGQKSVCAFHGQVARCPYAEGFKTYLPITNARWDKDPQYSLLDLEDENLKHLYDDNKNVLIICTHPDDWEISMGGTALKMKDDYNMHVIILTRGEGALGPDKAEETAKLRKEQAEKSCEKINAKLQIMDFGDAGLTASKEAVDSLIKQLEIIDPGLVFCHWGMDKADHAAASNICTKALASTGMIHDRQIYYFGGSANTLSHFEPEIYVNIDDVIEEKKELIQIHHLPNHAEGVLVNMALQSNKYFGAVNRCKYAEGFRTQYPLVNHRWDKKALHWLLNL